MEPVQPRVPCVSRCSNCKLPKVETQRKAYTSPRSGFRPLAVCSPHNFELAQDYGAETCFDYRSPSCASDIKTYTKGNLKFVLDCITEVSSTTICYQAIGRAGGLYVALEIAQESILATRKTVKPNMVLAIAIFGKPILLDGGYARGPDPELRVFGRKWFEDVQHLLDQGKIRPHPVKIMSGGWDGILKALDSMRYRKVSGEKLVFKIE